VKLVNKTFIKWDAFGPEYLLGTTRRVFEGMSIRGLAPKFIRISPGGPAWYLSEDIEDFIEKKFSEIHLDKAQGKVHEVSA
jgi:hypothetical protein